MEKNCPPRLSSPERRQALLRAAEEVFVEQGFANARINDIIKRAGGSKRSIYQEFGDKEGLFLTLLEEKFAHLNQSLKIDASYEGDLRASLLAVARPLMRQLLTPEILSARRLIMSEGLRFPHLIQNVPALGPEWVIRILADILQKADEAGEARVEDPLLAAEIFMGMSQTNLLFHVSLNLRQVPDLAEMEKRVCMATDIFVNGVTRKKPAAQA